MIGEIIGSGISAAANLIGGHSARQHASREADEAEAFSERMSSTAYQRAAADMKAAGLNPALMYGSGGPSSSPQGVQAPIENIFDGALDQVVTTALDKRRLEKEIDQTDSVIETNKASADAAHAAAELSRANARAVDAETTISRKKASYTQLIPEAKDVKGIWGRIKDVFKNAADPETEKAIRAGDASKLWRKR